MGEGEEGEEGGERARVTQLRKKTPCNHQWSVNYALNFVQGINPDQGLTKLTSTIPMSQ